MKIDFRVALTSSATKSVFPEPVERNTYSCNGFDKLSNRSLPILKIDFRARGLVGFGKWGYYVELWT